MQFFTPALHSVGAGVGDGFSLVAPQNLIPPALHLPYEILPAGAGFHSFPNIVHQPEFPALPLSGCPVFPGSHLPSAALILGQNGEVVGLTDFVTDLPELPQGFRGLVQLQPGFKADGVDHKVGMDMLGIAVGGHLYLMPRPRPLGKLQSDGVGLLIGDVLSGRDGLHILVEIDSIQLAVGGFGGEKFRERTGSIAVNPADIAVPCLRIGGLVLPLTVAHDSLHGADVLLGFLNVGYSCQPLPPIDSCKTAHSKVTSHKSFESGDVHESLS